MTLVIESFFDQPTYSVSYVVADAASGACVIIDPVLDFDAASGRTGHEAADRIAAFVRERKFRVSHILETHAHADRLSAAPYLKAQLGGAIAIGAHIVEVQRTFARLFNMADFVPDGRPFDRLLHEGDTLALGSATMKVMHTPGHTPACVTYLIQDAAFVGDTLFMPDYGTARTDFPGGDARVLYRSIKRMLALPEETRLFLCHDYKAHGRDYFAWETTVYAQRRANIHIHDGITEDAFAAMRAARDRTLEMPRLLLPAIQVNIRAGALPPAEANGIRYLKLPIDAF